MPAGIGLKWNTTLLNAQIQKGLTHRFSLIGEHVTNAHKTNLSRPVTKLKKKRKRKTSRGAKGSSYTAADPNSRSKAGEYPKAETGLLMKNIFWDLKATPIGLQLKIGTPSKYGAALETDAGRKGLRATMIQEVPMIKNILKVRGAENSAFVFTRVK